MIRITIEMIPKGDESKKRHLGTATITNNKTAAVNGAEDPVGNYDVTLSKWGRPDVTWKRGKVAGFPRKKFGAWDLLLWALISLIGDRSMSHIMRNKKS